MFLFPLKPSRLPSCSWELWGRGGVCHHCPAHSFLLNIPHCEFSQLGFPPCVIFSVALVLSVQADLVERATQSQYVCHTPAIAHRRSGERENEVIYLGPIYFLLSVTVLNATKYTLQHVAKERLSVCTQNNCFNSKLHCM